MTSVADRGDQALTFTPFLWGQKPNEAKPIVGTDEVDTAGLAEDEIVVRRNRIVWKRASLPVEIGRLSSQWSTENQYIIYYMALSPILGVRGEGDMYVATIEFSDTIPDHIAAMVHRASPLLRWREEGVAAPSLECKELTKDICQRIYNQYHLIPSRITASRVEGLYVVYHHLRNGRSFSIEVDNELDCIAQVFDQDSIFLTDSIAPDENIEALMKCFNGG